MEPPITAPGGLLHVDPTLVNLLVSYAANVGADATMWVAGKFRRQPVDEVEASVGALNISIQAQLTSNDVDENDAAKVAAFLLRTPILGYLFMMVEEAARAQDYEGFAQEEFAALLHLETGLGEPAAVKSASVLVDVLSAALSAGKRPTRRNFSTIRNRPLSGIQLFGAQEAKRRILAEVGSPSLAEIAAYSAHFRREMRKKFSRIQLQHLDNGTEQKLSDLYVEPDLQKQDVAAGSKADFKPTQVLENNAAIVIQGPAGSGKSTIVRRLAADLAGRSDDTAVPIVVELRKYSAQQGLAPQLFLDHIKQSVAQLTQQTPPDSWLEYLLVSGRAVIFFDGLDEVLDSGTRSDVRDAVRSFAQLFPASSFVVTSRFTGYDLAPLDRDEWAHFSVRELREDQVRDYATLWFKLKDAQSDPAARATSFIEESRVYASDLRTNPLMLSLLCSVYYSRGDIPRTLHALYEQCADMIYRQWNTMRGIDDHRAWDKDVRPILYQVAHTVLNNSDYISQGIPARELVAEIQRAFMSNGAPDAEEASSRARETLALWAGRAWIITPVMTDPNGRLRYGFVHQSFLEYFAAVYEVRRVDTPAELYANLRSRLIELNGWTVTQIAVSVIQDWKVQGAERFIEAVLNEIDQACDLDAYSLWRLVISLVSVVTVPAEQLERIAAGAIHFVSRSIEISKGDEATYESHEANRDRRRDFDQFEQDRDSPIVRSQVQLPTTESDAVLHDLAEVSRDGDVAAVVARSSVAGFESAQAEVVLAALLLAAILKDEHIWLKELDEAAKGAFDTERDHSWVAIWAAAQLGFIAIETAVHCVPWHALLLHQELVLSSRTDMSGPRIFTPDLLAAINHSETYALLESVGEVASDTIAAGGNLPRVSKNDAAVHFVFLEPASDWKQADDPSAWSDAFLTTFAMLGKMASLGWNTGHALGEIVNDSPRDAVREIAAASVGWGGMNDSTLRGLSDKYAAAIDEILSTSWPARK